MKFIVQSKCESVKDRKNRNKTQMSCRRVVEFIYSNIYIQKAIQNYYNCDINTLARQECSMQI